MSFRKTLLLIAVIILLLLPVGQLFRNQNPWSCFAFTFDESFFAQAAYNWSEGNGYRMAGHKEPFGPSISVGLPMAWGAHAVHLISGQDIAHSGRIFVYFCFFLLLLMISHHAFRREKNWIAVPIALGIFGYAMSKITFGGYFVFGFLGEGPALLAGAITYYLLDRRQFFISGVFATLAFIIKPTFVFFMPSVALASVLFSVHSGLTSSLGISAVLIPSLIGIASARNQTLFAYLNEFYISAQSIAGDTPQGTLFTYYKKLPFFPAISAFSIAFLALGALGSFRFKAQKAPPSRLAAFIFFLTSTLFFILRSKAPVEKQWSALFCMTLIAFSVDWGNLIGQRFAGWIPRDFVRTAFICITVTFLLAVGTDALHRFKRLPENACPSKEQSYINAKLADLANKKAVTPDNLRVLVDIYPYWNFLYRIGWGAQYAHQWSELKSKPTWVAGTTNRIFPLPKGCAPYWEGEKFSIAKCEK